MCFTVCSKIQVIKKEAPPIRKGLFLNYILITINNVYSLILCSTPLL